MLSANGPFFMTGVFVQANMPDGIQRKGPSGFFKQLSSLKMYNLLWILFNSYFCICFIYYNRTVIFSI